MGWWGGGGGGRCVAYYDRFLDCTTQLTVHMVLGKEVLRIGHGLELQGISTRVLEEHRPLLARLAFKTKMWLDDEWNGSCLHPAGKLTWIYTHVRG